jgi:hypothetical protein
MPLASPPAKPATRPGVASFEGSTLNPATLAQTRRGAGRGRRNSTSTACLPEGRQVEPDRFSHPRAGVTRSGLPPSRWRGIQTTTRRDHLAAVPHPRGSPNCSLVKDRSRASHPSLPPSRHPAG